MANIEIPGGTGGIGGSTGATDNAVIRADGAGGSTVQASSLLIGDGATPAIGYASEFLGTEVLSLVKQSGAGTITITPSANGILLGIASVSATGNATMSTGGDAALVVAESDAGVGAATTIASALAGGSQVFGVANAGDGQTGIIRTTAGALGSMASGHVDAGGTIETRDWGCRAHGHVEQGAILRVGTLNGEVPSFGFGGGEGPDATFFVDGQGSVGFGYIQATTGFAGDIDVQGGGSMGGGTVIAQTTASDITASGAGSIAWGMVTDGSIVASGNNALQLGPGTNDESLSIQVGDLAGDGVRIIGSGVAGAVNGEVWKASGNVTVQTGGNPLNLSAIATGFIADDAITLAKLAAGTAGNLITFNASGDPAAVATGTAGHVLTSNGAGAAPTFQAAAGGGVALYKTSVRVATTSTGTLASSFENGDTIDGVVLATGNRILIKNQGTATENGIYTVNATGAPTRASDFAAAATVAGSLIPVMEGTANADTLWQCTNNAGSDVVGTDNLAFKVASTPVSTAANEVIIGDGAGRMVRSGVRGTSNTTGTRSFTSTDAALMAVAMTTGGTASVTQPGAVILGQIQQTLGTAQITVGGVGGTAMGSAICSNASGTSQIRTNGQGGSAFGNTNVTTATTARIAADANGGFATGYATSGEINVVGIGGFAQGQATNGNNISAGGAGSLARGSAQGGGISTGAGALGSFASGVTFGTGTVASSGGGQLIGGLSSSGTISGGASATGSLAWGQAGSGQTISVTAANAFQFGIGTNATADSLQVGANFRAQSNGQYRSIMQTVTLAAAATTFATTSNVIEVTGDGGGNTVATITGGINGQFVLLKFVDGNVTMTDTAAATANTFNLAGGFTSAANRTLMLVFDGNKWFEVSRSLN